MSGLYYRKLRPLDLTEMYIAFLDAFSDYPVEFRLSKEQFVRKFVEKLKISFPLSVGAYDYDALAGFIFTSVNYYKGKLTAYNGGTGVRPNYRGKKVVSEMYDYLIPLLAEKRIKQCVLEVLVQNERAIKAYQNVGFEIVNYFKCFKLKVDDFPEFTPKIPLEILTVKSPDWHTYYKFSDYNPSFLDCPNMINENLVNEQIIEVRHEGQCVGYAIFQPLFGRISQIGVNPHHRRNGVGTSIIAYIYQISFQKALTIINIDGEANDTIEFFERIGFKNELDQHEMILDIN